MPLEDELLAIERTLWEGGPDAYLEHTDDTCLVVFAEMAAKMTKADIAKSAEAGRWREVSITPKGMTQLTEGVVVVAYECRARRPDGEDHHALVSSAYVKRPAGWKLAFHQQTPVA